MFSCYFSFYLFVYFRGYDVAALHPLRLRLFELYSVRLTFLACFLFVFFFFHFCWFTRGMGVKRAHTVIQKMKSYKEVYGVSSLIVCSIFDQALRFLRLEGKYSVPVDYEVVIIFSYFDYDSLFSGTVYSIAINFPSPM